MIKKNQSGDQESIDKSNNLNITFGEDGDVKS